MNFCLFSQFGDVTRFGFKDKTTDWIRWRAVSVNFNPKAVMKMTLFSFVNDIVTTVTLLAVLLNAGGGGGGGEVLEKDKYR